MKAPRPCLEGDCLYPAAKRLQRCRWHWLLKQAPQVRAQWAADHEAPAAAAKPSQLVVGRERWCSPCGRYVPLFYTTGSKCKGHASKAAHASRVQAVYGISGADYDALLAYQGGVCYVCRRKPGSKRLAVDHDHESGEVRGLLCADSERGCNHKVIGLLEANSQDGGYAAAQRVVDYLNAPPYDRMKKGIAPMPTRGEQPVPF